MAGNNLLDIIKQNSAQATQQLAPTEQAGGIAQLLRAKSGTAATGGPVADVSLAERVENANTASTLANQVAPAAALQNQQLDQQAEAQRQTAMAIKDDQDQQSRANIQKFNNSLDDTLQGLAQSRGQLDFNKDRAQVESIMQQARLANDQYSTKLREVGTRNRLDNEAEFRKAMAQAAFGDNLQLIQGKLDADALTSSNDRQFKEALSQIDINDIMAKRDQGISNLRRGLDYGISQARSQADKDIRSANLQAQFSSVSSVISSLSQMGIKGLDDYENQKGLFKPDQPSTGGGTPFESSDGKQNVTTQQFLKENRNNWKK